ncbi:3-deoxy-D-manno-octulosonic acid kinase [Marinagarivorans cellulosilyticus]|uniref:3-deoxy-D-manno-octulosonic acid kinase n=1 Tax=Marinagarivorans cellulosilyticus TaxID=2721545 RepID=A0AAN1WH73_9GAMM|nr:3-deoxy-D-manno-octulosonic acid kinase [Marinagarivorans cellulosilyticus]BCD97542.1 3-deoxy-D-manno-octulosonic acid kinase [Marinagarivorans cellulosilyticus]
MPSIAKLSRNLHLLDCTNGAVDITQDWFSPRYWQQQKAITGQSSGRSTTYFIQNNSDHYVLRHYYRGGMVRHIMRDTYAFSGLKNTRVYAELEILQKLNNWGLPAPTPIAGLIARKGLWYRADILMKQIPNARDLFQHLQKHRLSAQEWRNVGMTIGYFHQHGVYHADLNCHNIMRDKQGKIWLIDFDRAKLQTDAQNKTSWTAQNLGRLFRSLNKELGRCSQFAFEQQDWEQLLIGYDSIK